MKIIKKHKSYVKLTICKKKFNKKDYRLISMKNKIMLQLNGKKKIDNIANIWLELRFEFIKIMKIRNEIKKLSNYLYSVHY